MLKQMLIQCALGLRLTINVFFFIILYLVFLIDRRHNGLDNIGPRIFQNEKKIERREMQFSYQERLLNSCTNFKRNPFLNSKSSGRFFRRRARYELYATRSEIVWRFPLIANKTFWSWASKVQKHVIFNALFLMWLSSELQICQLHYFF